MAKTKLLQSISKLKKRYKSIRKNEMQFLLLIVGVITVMTIIGFLLTFSISNEKDMVGKAVDSVLVIVRIPGNTIMEYTSSGQTPYDWLMETQTIQVKEILNDVLITCINNFCSGDDHHWEYYVNDVKGQERIFEYVIQSGQTIEFRIIGIEN